jgi:hypothetical protein
LPASSLSTCWPSKTSRPPTTLRRGSRITLTSSPNGRQVTRDEARAQKILVVDLEDDDVLQDLVLSVSHATQMTFSSTPCAKLVENHHGRSWLVLEGQQLLHLGAPGVPDAALPTA